VKRGLATIAVLACTLAFGCKSAPRSPYFGDEKYLRFGVEPDAEAKAVIDAHQQRGDKLDRRVNGHDFTAVGFLDSHARPSDVRVITRRGIELSLEPDTDLLKPERVRGYALLPAPIEGTQDADGDGFEELFVREEHASVLCVLVFRVRDVGFVDPVKVEGAHLFGQATCPSEVEDVDHDGHAELIMEVTLQGFETREPARVRVPLWAHEHQFVLDANAPGAAAFHDDETKPRLFDLAEARRTLDLDWTLRLAIELAALSSAAGESTTAQLKAFDGALAGLVLDERHADAVRAARARIESVWSQPSPNPEPAAKNAAP
jgi:hypothetical protein